MLLQKFQSIYSALGSSMGNVSQAGCRQQDNCWVDLRNGRTVLKRGRGRPRGPSRTRGGKSQRRAINSRDESCNLTARKDKFALLPGWKGRSRARGSSKKGRRSIRSSRRKPPTRAFGNAFEKRGAKDIASDYTAGLQQEEWNLAATPVETEGAENVSSSERSEFDNDNGQASADEFDDLLVDDFSGARSGKSGRFTESVEYGMGRKGDERVEDGDDVDYVNYDDDYNDDEDGDDGMDEREDYYVEGYINSDYQEEGNQSTGGGRVGNVDRSSDGDSASSSSSEYSY